MGEVLCSARKQSGCEGGLRAPDGVTVVQWLVILPTGGVLYAELSLLKLACARGKLFTIVASSRSQWLQIHASTQQQDRETEDGRFLRGRKKDWRVLFTSKQSERLAKEAENRSKTQSWEAGRAEREETITLSYLERKERTRPSEGALARRASVGDYPPVRHVEDGMVRFVCAQHGGDG